MSDQMETPPGLRRLGSGSISLEDRLESIETMCREILTKENATITDVALIKSKLELHDKILMGVCGIVGTAIITAGISLVVIKGNP